MARTTLIFLRFTLTILLASLSFFLRDALAVPVQTGLDPLCSSEPNSGIFSHQYEFKNTTGISLKIDYNSVYGWQFDFAQLILRDQRYFYKNRTSGCEEELILTDANNSLYRTTRTGILFRSLQNGWFDLHDDRDGSRTRFKPLIAGGPQSLPFVRTYKNGLQDVFYYTGEKLTRVEINRLNAETNQFEYQIDYNDEYPIAVKLKNKDFIISHWVIQYDQHSFITRISADSDADFEAYEYYHTQSPSFLPRGLMRFITNKSGGRIAAYFVNAQQFGLTPTFKIFAGLGYRSFPDTSIQREIRLQLFYGLDFPPLGARGEWSNFPISTVSIRDSSLAKAIFWKKDLEYGPDSSGIFSLLTKRKDTFFPEGPQSPKGSIETFDYTYSYGGPQNKLSHLTGIQTNKEGEQRTESGVFDFEINRLTQITSKTGPSSKDRQVSLFEYQPFSFTPNQPFIVKKIKLDKKEGPVDQEILTSRTTWDYDGNNLINENRFINSVEMNTTNYSGFNQRGLPTRITHKNGTYEILDYDEFGRITERKILNPTISATDGGINKYAYDPKTHLIASETKNKNIYNYSYDALDRITRIQKLSENNPASIIDVIYKDDGVVGTQSNNTIEIRSSEGELRIIHLDGFQQPVKISSKVSDRFAGHTTWFNTMGQAKATTPYPIFTKDSLYDLTSITALLNYFPIFIGNKITGLLSPVESTTTTLNGLTISAAESPTLEDLLISHDKMGPTIRKIRDENRNQITLTNSDHQQVFKWESNGTTNVIKDITNATIKETRKDLLGRLTFLKLPTLPTFEYEYAQNENNEELLGKYFGFNYSGATGRVIETFKNGRLINRDYGTPGEPGFHALRSYYDQQNNLIARGIHDPEMNPSNYWNNWSHNLTINSYDNYGRITSTTETNPAYLDTNVNCEYKWTDAGQLSELDVIFMPGVKVGFKVKYHGDTGEPYQIFAPNVSSQPVITYSRPNIPESVDSRQMDYNLTNEKFEVRYNQDSKIATIQSTSSGKLLLGYRDLLGNLESWTFQSPDEKIVNQEVTQRGAGRSIKQVVNSLVGLAQRSIDIRRNRSGQTTAFRRVSQPGVRITYSPEDPYQIINYNAAGLDYPVTYNSMKQITSYSNPFEEKISALYNSGGSQREATIHWGRKITNVQINPSVHTYEIPFMAQYETTDNSNPGNPVQGPTQIEANYCGGFYRTLTTIQGVKSGVFEWASVSKKGYLYLPGLQLSGTSLDFYPGFVGMIKISLDQDLTPFNNSFPPYYIPAEGYRLFAPFKDFEDITRIIRRDIENDPTTWVSYPNPEDPYNSYKTESGRSFIFYNPADLSPEELNEKSSQAFFETAYLYDVLPALNGKLAPGLEAGSLTTPILSPHPERRDAFKHLNRINDENSRNENRSSYETHYIKSTHKYEGNPKTITELISKYQQRLTNNNDNNRELQGILGDVMKYFTDRNLQETQKTLEKLE